MRMQAFLTTLLITWTGVYIYGSVAMNRSAGGFSENQQTSGILENVTPDAQNLNRLFCDSLNGKPGIQDTGGGPEWISRRFQIELKGTVSDRMAIVLNLASGREEMVRTNDRLGEATVLEIARNRLVLGSADSREELRLPSDLTARSDSHLSGSVQAAQNRISRADLQTMLKDVGSLSQEIAMQPVRGAQGELAGYRISSLKPQGLMARMGLRKNDLLLAVNGQSITTPEEIFRVLEEAAHLERFAVNVRRNQSDVQIQLIVD